MKAILGRKLGMTQVFSPQGESVPVTLIEARPNAVALRRTVEQDGYAAVQLALPRTKGLAGGVHPHQLTRLYAMRREFALPLKAEVNEVTVDQFAVGDRVTVTGVSKGKGFQGVVKRHHFAGGPASHGHRHMLRKGGSIGSRFPQHTRPGKRMPGRMGGERVTVPNLEVVAVDTQHHVLAVQGAVPGKRGSLVAVYQLTA